MEVHTKGDSEEPDGVPRSASGTYTSTITVWGMEITSATGSSPGEAMREAKKKFAAALKEVCS